MVDVEAVRLAPGVGHARTRALGRDEGAGVPHLPARLGVEGRLVDDQRGRGAGVGLRDIFAVHDQSPDHALCCFRAVAEELGGADPLADREPGGIARRVARAGPGPAGGLALAFHADLKTLALDRAPLGAERILGEVEGKADRCRRGGTPSPPDSGAPGASPAVASSSRRRPRASVSLKRVSSSLRVSVMNGSARISSPNAWPISRTSTGTRRHMSALRAAHQVGMAHGAAHDPPQHVAAALVRRHHAVGHQEGARPQVIGNHPVRRAVSVPSAGAPLISTLAAIRLRNRSVS